MKRARGLMNKIGPIVIAAAVLLVVPAGDLCAKSRARGAEVVIQRTDGAFLAGELLAVQGRALVVSDRISARDVTIGIDDVRAIRIVRESNVLTAILEGRSREKADFALKKLGGMALFRSALPANFDGVGRQPKIGAPLATKDGHIDDLMAPRSSRFHLSFELGFSTFGEIASLKRLFKNMDFGDTRPAAYDNSGRSYRGPTSYPRAVPDLSGGFTVEYSLNRSFAVGFAFASLRTVEVEGYRMIPRYDYYQHYNGYDELYASATSAGEGYFITAAWRPTPELHFNRYSFKLGVELGIYAARMTFGTLRSIFERDRNIEERSVTKTIPAAGVVAGLDRHLGRIMSLGVWARYRYASTRVGAFSLNAAYEDGLDEEGNPINVPITVAFPAHRINLGGPAAGVSLGLHF